MAIELFAFLEQYHEAARRFARADPEGAKAIYSRADDVLLANPFGPAVVGWDAVGQGLEFASSRLQDGDVPRFEVLARYESGDTVVVHTLEDWRARVPGRPEIEPFQLRATSVLRRENGAWRIVLRHADPIATRASARALTESAAFRAAPQFSAGGQGQAASDWAPTGAFPVQHVPRVIGQVTWVRHARPVTTGTVPALATPPVRSWRREPSRAVSDSGQGRGRA
jgi:ketosteroid isomerase-like protein